MKSIVTLLAISASLLVSGNAMAAWQDIGKNDQSTVYVDTATLQTQGNLAQIMSMLDFKKPGQDPQTKENVNSIIGLNEYDCSTGKYRPIEFKVFTGNRGKGKVVVDQKTPDSIFEAIPNGSWAAGVFNVACRSK
ncbi:surface-adhesin E family protein [Polynucleobacter sp. AP-Kaivos-20-H2]|jgi:hypothetical protein|uniref:surface-adhesin E family protein n=1 Tax=Polynucleobacter sp. AP-Kaivos-20-H2 TaxID=2689104 RepID=UPI001C0B841F|nr:surface-adhesin E family protein [Polynucleobacter sp. AP-Kaivos-20-H2]MBU3603478.1 hypothetical protein [Polynucleobacter sp. AP-Kaivos-20-H2]